MSDFLDLSLCLNFTACQQARLFQANVSHIFVVHHYEQCANPFPFQVQSLFSVGLFYQDLS